MNIIFWVYRFGASMERKIERIFSRWGFFCAKHPAVVMLVGIVLVMVLASGLAMFKVITDPVELWSSPTCRARQEKNYFDDNFT